ncbi:hypothetical protein KFZ58_04260 [Virgibacillus sp. NKC19-16]|uniref:hypothetical protein n=1 Tax=Virgibacillus salidurans TaxID=2831673 RepID=UPI001F1D44AA|nr:hypothetical protein [Virgibacillus sp. NKC19-16]UJL47140.1 hypothetical protein KFZ58_04260 [Virgibacillus sp. NKC19-16]
MVTIGISLIFLAIISILALLTFIVPVIIAVRAPRKISFVILGLLILHWVFFLTNGYTLLSTNIANAMFVPVWLVLCVAGAFTAIYEFKNNKGFAITVAVLTTISLLFSILAHGIGKM